MARKRYTAEQIIGLMREAEVRLGQGQTIAAICRTMGVILPLDWRAGERFSTELRGRPSLAAGRTTFTYETPLAALPEAAAPDLKTSRSPSPPR